MSPRPQVLDYFTQQRLTIRDDHILFRWEKDMDCDSALVTLLDQVCLEIGFNRDYPSKDFLSYYATGEFPSIIDFYPELEVYRDIIFIFKFMQTPSNEALPEIKYWYPADARLTWTYDREKKRFTVKGFGGKVLKPYAMMPEGAIKGKSEHLKELEVEEREKRARGELTADDEESVDLQQARADLAAAKEREKESKPGFLSSLFSRFFGGKSRAPPSAADPSALCGQEINNEDDVLHVHRLPDFGGRITQRNSELLVSYLTAPYLRIPLILSFFAHQERLNSLGSEKLRALVDGVLFEPGAWMSKQLAQKPLPDTIPYDRSYLATCNGLLMNELVASPQGVCSSLKSLLDLALDLDSGRWTPSSSPIILYVLRLQVRVEQYINFLVWHHEMMRDAPDSVSGTTWSSYIRGMEISPESYAVVKAHAMRMRRILNEQVFPMIDRWTEQATQANEIPTACILHAHSAYLFKNVAASDLTKPIVITLLAAQIFLTTRYRYELDSEPGTKEKRKSAQERSKEIEAKRRKEAAKKDDKDDKDGSAVDDGVNAEIDSEEGELGIPETEVRRPTGREESDRRSHGSVPLMASYVSSLFSLVLSCVSSSSSRRQMFDLFQKKRVMLLQWLEADKAQGNEVMEAVIRISTFTGNRDRPTVGKAKPKKVLEPGEEDEEEKAPALVAPVPMGGSSAKDSATVIGAATAGESAEFVVRNWRSMPGRNCKGRYIPDMSRSRRKGSFTKQSSSSQLVTGADAVGQGSMTMTNRKGAASSGLPPSHKGAARGSRSNSVAGSPSTSRGGSPSASGSSTPTGARTPRGTQKVQTGFELAGLDAQKTYKTYEDYLRYGVNPKNDTEINLQLGDLTLKANRLEVLDPVIQRMEDFRTLFGSESTHRVPLQSAEVKNTVNRMWVRLVGRRHDLQYWHADERKTPMNLEREYKVGGMGGSEQWIVASFEHVRAKYLTNLKFYLPRGEYSASATVAILCGHDGATTLKEVVCFRKPPVCHIYNVVEHGRRYYRTLVYSSDAKFCLQDLVPHLTIRPDPINKNNVIPHYESGNPLIKVEPAPSVVITRSLNALLGTQTFLPERFLRGLIPSTLLEDFMFWQSESDSLTGYIKPEKMRENVLSATPPCIRVQIAGNTVSSTHVRRREQDEEDVRPNSVVC